MPEKASRTHYETLQVHPAAPFDLITAAYWRLNGDIDGDGDEDHVSRRRHELAQAYSVLADKSSRDAYDHACGLPPRQPAPKVRRGRPLLLSLFAGASPSRGTDYYEIIRVQPDATRGVIEDAYASMRTQYLRLVRAGHAPVQLLDALEEAYAVTSDRERRLAYDAKRRGTVNGGSPSVRGPAASRHVEIGVPTPAAKKAVDDASRVVRAPIPETKRARTRIRIDWRLRDRVASVALGLRKVARPSVWLVRTTLAVIGLIPRILWALGEFVVATTRATVAPPGTTQLAVRRIWPEEEDAVLARLAASAARTKTVAEGRLQGMVATVVIEGGSERGARFEVRRWPITVGSDRQCDIVLPDLAPEQLHLLNRDGKSVLYSLSENPPVLVNGEPVAWAEITADDSVVLGGHTLKVDDSDSRERHEE